MRQVTTAKLFEECWNFSLQIYEQEQINVNRIRDIVSFELSKEIDKKMFFVLSRVWDKERESP